MAVLDEAATETDEATECYTTALLYGLLLINEKEHEKGLPLCSVKVDADALVHFVRRKGDMLFKHFMSKDTAIKRRICWNDLEIHSVATEFARLYPGRLTFPAGGLEEAQKVLPVERQKANVNYAMKKAIRLAIDGKPIPARISGRAAAKSRADAPPKPTVVPRTAPGALIPMPASLNGALSVPEMLADALADQIVAALREVNVKALALAAQKLAASTA